MFFNEKDELKESLWINIICQIIISAQVFTHLQRGTVSYFKLDIQGTGTGNFSGLPQLWGVAGAAGDEYLGSACVWDHINERHHPCPPVLALWLASNTEAFCHNDGGHPGIDSSLSFPLVSNHLRFKAPPSLSGGGEGALIVSCKHSHKLHTNIHITQLQKYLYVFTSHPRSHAYTCMHTSHKHCLAPWGSFVVV